MHISEKTLSFLNGEFEVSDGDGASREEAIRLAGIKTYFIEKVLKSVREDQRLSQILSNSYVNNNKSFLSTVSSRHVGRVEDELFISEQRRGNYATLVDQLCSVLTCDRVLISRNSSLRP